MKKTKILTSSGRLIVRSSIGLPRVGAQALKTLVMEVSRNRNTTELPLVFLGEVIAGMCQNAGPVFIKLGQILATREDLLPSALCNRLSRLYDEQKPVPYRKIESILRAHYGQEWPFAMLEKKPLGVGSVGQVHAGRLHDNTEVVVKVIKPGVNRQIENDLEIFRSLMTLIPEETRKQFAMLERAFEDLREGFEKELNLEEEAKNLLAFKARCQKNRKIYVPDCYISLSSRDLLVMEKIEGTPIGKLDLSPDRDPEQRKETKAIAKLILKEILGQVFEQGHFHGDPHAGNLILMPDGRIAFLDLGLTGNMTPEHRRALLQAVKALLSQNPDRAMECLLSFAVVPEQFDKQHFRERIAAIYRHHRHQSSSESLERLVSALLKEAYKSGLYLPDSTTIFIKTVVTVEGVVKRLDPGLDLKATATSAVLTSGARALLRSLSKSFKF